MIKRTGLIVLLALGLALSGGCANSSRYAGIGVDIEHAKAIEGMLYATNAVNIALKSVHLRLKQLAVTDPENAEIVKDGLKIVDENYMVRKMIPIYAKYFNREQAAEIARFYNRKTGQKLTELAGKSTISSDSYDRYLSHKERSEVNEFLDSNAGQLMMQASPRIRTDLSALGKQIGEQLSQQ